MLEIALFLFLVALVAGVLGFTNIAQGAAAAARIFFYIALAGFAVAVLLIILGISIIA